MIVSLQAISEIDLTIKVSPDPTVAVLLQQENISVDLPDDTPLLAEVINGTTIVVDSPSQVSVTSQTLGAQGFQGVAGPQGSQGNRGTQGDRGNQGTQGPQGIAGTPGTSFLFTQNTLATTWIINHNLGYLPAVALFDANGSHFGADIFNVNENQTIVTLSFPIAGYARLT